jgi:quinoprotein dehydrogenase-associated probable ABC transporter substrate-binding protein
MCFRYLSAVLLISFSLTGASRRVLRVCADPNNLPFSNQAGEGLENRVAELVAVHLRAELQYTWWAERKSFLRDSLQAGLCDVVMGVPSTLDSVSVTRPYYQSTYVFVERADRHLEIASLNDPRLEQLKIGIHIVGNDYAPPAHLLARRGLASQLAAYRLYGPLGEPNPPSQLISAVVNRDVDVAIIWGPFAGYFAQLQAVKLQITPVSPTAFLAVPFTYDISAGVRKDNTSLRDELDRVFTAECGKIAAILKQYAIPRIQGVPAKCESSQPAAAFSH